MRAYADLGLMDGPRYDEVALAERVFADRTDMPYESMQLARAPLLLLDYANQAGMDRHELERAAGLTEAMLDDPDSRVPTICMRRLWSAVMKYDVDPTLGLRVGSAIRAAQMGLVGYTMYYSRDLDEALCHLARYSRILTEAVRYEWQSEEGRKALVGYADPALVALRHPIEAGLSAIVAIAREIVGTRVCPAEVHLPTPEPEAELRKVYRNMFSCPVTFGSVDARVSFEEELLHLPTVAADPGLTNYLDDLATIKLDELGADNVSLVQRIRQQLWTALPSGRADLWRVSSDLGMSARTLQRRLGEEGTSFSKVLDDLRRELSNELLEDRKLAVAEVAFLLGYSEPSAFQRAFRRWRGVTPRRYRSDPSGS